MSLSSTAASRFLESRIGSHRRVEVYAAAGRREIRRSRWLRSGRTDEQRSKRIRMRARAAQEVSPEMGRLGAADPSSGRGGDLQLRPVRPADRERIIEITKDVWEGRDYIPRVFDSWVADAGASFQAAEIEGVVVGVQRLRPYAPGLVWYEGLRVAAATWTGTSWSDWPAAVGSGLGRVAARLRCCASRGARTSRCRCSRGEAARCASF